MKEREARRPKHLLGELIAVSLRMNLYGWSIQDFRDVLGRNDQGVLEAATVHLSEAIKDSAVLARATAWLRTLIEVGYPLRQDQPPQREPEDGGLLTVRMETEAHVFVVYSIARAIRRETLLDLAGESSQWAHRALGAVYRELAACGFTRSKDCRPEFFAAFSALSNGSPLFGDDFRTQWAFYSVLTQAQLAALIPILQAGAAFTRPIPPDYPEPMAQSFKTCISDDGKTLLNDLAGWFGRLEQAGQDALIIWW